MSVHRWYISMDLAETTPISVSFPVMSADVALLVPHLSPHSALDECFYQQLYWGPRGPTISTEALLIKIAKGILMYLQAVLIVGLQFGRGPFRAP